MAVVVKNIKSVVLLILFATLITPFGAANAEITIAVNAPRGKLQAMKQWVAYGEYLSLQVDDHVTILPLSPSELIKRTAELDFVIANPTQSVVLVEELKAIPLATLSKKFGPQFAGVIVAKKGSGITTGADLKGKKVMSLKFRQAAGGYLFQTYHLMQQGIDPHRDFSSMREGKKQDDLVLAVGAGLIDAAFIRTGILETMQKEKKISIDDFTIVDQRKTEGFELLHTTDLYPEWYLLAMPKQAKLADKVKQLSIKVPAAVAAKAKIKGMVEPVSMDGMKKVMKELSVRPYNK